MCRACRLEPDPERQPVVVAHLGLHAHHCSECGLLRTCYADPCAYRGRGDNARDSRHAGALAPWVCFICEDFETERLNAALSETAA